MEKAKYQILNSLAIKIIVLITMSIDHVGNFLQLYFYESNANLLLMGDIFRIIGRLTLPLIAILFAEAMHHTHDKEHYIARLGLMSVLILACEIAIHFATNLDLLDGNIFLTILCSATFIYFLESKDKKQFLIVIPFAIIILSFINDIQGSTSFYPTYLKAQYSLYGFILMVGSYLIYKLSDKRVKQLTNDNRSLDELRKYGYYRTYTNLLWCALLLVVTVIFWLLSYINSKLDMYNISVQSYALIAIAFIALYNGKKGYQSKKIQYSFYVYYPLHLLIIFLGFYLALGAPNIGW